MRVSIVTLLLLVIAVPLGAEEIRYKLDSRHTFPVFEVSHYGFSMQRGRFNRTGGTVTLDAQAGRGSIEVTIDPDSIDMGLDDWDMEMKGEGWFDVAQYPTIRFQSGQVKFRKGKPVSAEGTLTMRGVTRPAKLAISEFSCGKNPVSGKPKCGANASLSVKRSEFGMTKLLPGVADDVRVLIAVEAGLDQPAPAPTP